MLGGMLAGHDECSGDIIARDGQKYQRFYGMSSRAAMEKYAGGVAQYRAAEGKEVLVPYRGPIAGTAQEILGGACRGRRIRWTPPRWHHFLLPLAASCIFSPAFSTC